MIEQFVQAIVEQLEQPKADLEKNLRAVLSEMITRMELVSQEEFVRQQHALQDAQQNIAALHKQVETLTQQMDALDSKA